MKNLILILLLSFSIAQAQEFLNSPLVTIPGKNINYDFLLTRYLDYPNETAFICFENYVDNNYSIILKQLAPIHSEYITVYSDTLPQINPTISFSSEYDVRIVWQSKIDNRWQLLSRIYYPDLLGSVVQLTDDLEDCISPSLYYSYLCWIKGTDLNFGTVAESLHTITTIDKNCSNPEIMHESDLGPTTVDIVYEKTLDSHKLIKYAQYDDRNSTFETKILSDSSVNINPKFGYSLDVSYQRFVNGFWKAVIPDPYEYSDEWISEDRLYNIENPVYFTYPIPTKSGSNSIRDYFLVYESDSIQGNKEIILEFHPNWNNESRINISNMAGIDTEPYSTVMKDSVVFFWIHTVDENNSQIWWSKTLFDPYSNIEDEESNPASRFTLSQNYPNPFNPKTSIPFYLNNPEYISIFIYDIRGRRIKTLFSGKCQSGLHIKEWDGTNEDGIDVSSGLYFAILSLNDTNISRKMVLLK
jgi:hypothetical protein